MKKLLLCLLFLAVPLFADSTDRIGLDMIEDGATSWGSRIRANYEILDSSVAVLSNTNAFTGYTTYASSVAVSTISVSGKILIATPTYTGSSRFALSGTMSVGGGVSGGNIQACDVNFQNCATLDSEILHLANQGSTGVSVRHDNSATGGIQLFSGTVQGAFVTNGSNEPSVFSADRLMIGPTFGDRIGNTIEPSGDRSAFEEPVYIGTHTVSGTPYLAVTAPTSVGYAVLIGTSPSLSSTNYHMAVSTSGITTIKGLKPASYTTAQINGVTPREGAGEYVYCSDCGTVTTCVSTGTAVGAWALITAKTSRCQ